MKRTIIGLVVTAILITVVSFVYKDLDKPKTQPEVIYSVISPSQGPSVAPPTAGVAPTVAEQTQPPLTNPPAETQAPTAAPTNSTPAAAPSTPEEILNYYNTATQKVNVQNPGFTKNNSSELGAYNIEGDSLNSLKKLAGSVFDSVAREVISGTLACGNTSETIAKGSPAGAELKASTLTLGDITEAKCVDNGGAYTITLTLKPSKNPSRGGDFPIAKVSDDFLVLADLQANGQAQKLSVSGVDCSLENAVVTAVIDSATGNMTSFKLSYDYIGTLTGCAYKFTVKTFDGLSGSGSIKCAYECTNFQW